MDILNNYADDTHTLNLIYTLILLASIETFHKAIATGEQGSFPLMDSFIRGGNEFADDSQISSDPTQVPSYDPAVVAAAAASVVLDSDNYYSNYSLTSAPLQHLLAMSSSVAYSQVTQPPPSTSTTGYQYAEQEQSWPAPLPERIAKRFMFITGQLLAKIQQHLNEYTAATIAYFSLAVVILTMICCCIVSLMRSEEEKLKERYKKAKLSSESALSCQAERQSSARSSQASSSRGSDGSTTRLLTNADSIVTRLTLNQSESTTARSATKLFGSIVAEFNESRHQPSQLISGTTTTSGNNNYNLATHSNSNSSIKRLRIHELRRETYISLVRLLRPGCRTVILLCNSQTKIKLLSKFYECVYAYRKNKTLQFSFLLIEKNLHWYQELLRMALNEKRELPINPINCLGTVLVLNGFKKYFSVYHASGNSSCGPNEPVLLLEDSLLDHLPEWLERAFVGKVNRYFVRYWPEKMR